MNLRTDLISDWTRPALKKFLATLGEYHISCQDGILIDNHESHTFRKDAKYFIVRLECPHIVSYKEHLVIVYLREPINADMLPYIGNHIVGSVIETEDYVAVEYIGVDNRTNPYRKMLRSVMSGSLKEDRTNTGTISKFGVRAKFDISNNIVPLLTTRKMPWQTIMKELLWFISGSTNVEDLQKQNVHIWDQNTSKEYLDKYNLNLRENDIGPTYGFSYRHYGAPYVDCTHEYEGYDQLAEVIRLIKEEPNSRRIVLCLWNPSVLGKVALPPCTMLYQFYVIDDTLQIAVYQRSGDMGLGVPFNIAQAAVLAHIIAKITDKVATKLIYNLGDAHIYTNHVEAIKEVLTREEYGYPIVTFPKKNIDEYEYKDFVLVGYRSHPAIKMQMSV